MAPADVRGATDWASVIGTSESGWTSVSASSAGSPASARSADSVDTLDVAEDLGYATRRASNRPKEPGLVDSPSRASCRCCWRSARCCPAG